MKVLKRLLQIRFAVRFLALALLAGCATEPLRAPVGKHFSEAPSPQAERALVYLFRPGLTPFRGDEKPNVYIDGALKFPLLWKGYAALSLEAGEHMIEVRGESHASKDWNMGFKIKPEAGQTYFLAIWNAAMSMDVSTTMPVMAGSAFFFIPISATQYRGSGTKYELVKRDDAIEWLRECNLIYTE
jgi:Protein of unknown function (DUF2846)